MGAADQFDQLQRDVRYLMDRQSKLWIASLVMRAVTTATTLSFSQALIIQMASTSTAMRSIRAQVC